MTPQYQKLLDEAKQLSAEERIAIVGELLEITSSDPADDKVDDEFEYSSPLATEIQRRESELDSGKEQAIPHAEAMRLMFGSSDG
ncbi:hypothetical protein ETAA8_04420 [Anatilimnocola aggregata]|uniref:Uncharacterized protein n=1 Tax=Anatilimnocola aggregata TaxID=2528021 RepID=A0A517Y597_9BACT|nr:addiction module protein [Anatilimnocola aggregata]QDU25376.1 hypothetical protein ETAA8_04420 [Anatilimnocola aggregata]